MSRPACIVVANDGDDACGSVLDDLMQAALGRFAVAVQAPPFEAADCDVLVPLVDPGNVAKVVAAIPGWRARHQGGVVLPIAFRLSSEQLVELLSAGSFDFEVAPLCVGAFLARLQRALGTLCSELSTPVAPTLPTALGDLIGSSPAFLKQLAALPAIAGCDARVLILGETGTGKEAYARAIHYNSARAARPLVAVNCGAIPVELAESELFGHVRGAFSSAYAVRAGLVREAEGGTLFLDEIDSLSMAVQVKLLRFLNDMEFRPVGADSMLRADVRVIAASNQDLSVLVESGVFRRDLFFRLRVLQVLLPPLRERSQDICALALHFMQHHANRNRRPMLGLTPQAMRRLLQHDWPGNVRELKHVMERAVLLSQSSTIQADEFDLPPHSDLSDDDESFRAAKARMVDAFERQYVERLLATCNGNVTHASQMAKKNRRAFFELIRKHRISPERFRRAQASFAD